MPPTDAINLLPITQSPGAVPQAPASEVSDVTCGSLDFDIICPQDPIPMGLGFGPAWAEKATTKETKVHDCCVPLATPPPAATEAGEAEAKDEGAEDKGGDDEEKPAEELRKYDVHTKVRTVAGTNMQAVLTGACAVGFIAFIAVGLLQRRRNKEASSRSFSTTRAFGEDSFRERICRGDIEQRSVADVDIFAEELPLTEATTSRGEPEISPLLNSEVEHGQLSSLRIE
jgi:hypothetical protein